MSLYHMSIGSILLVGEGDFSFSVAFIHHVASRVQVTSTCLLTSYNLKRLHKAAEDNVRYLTDRGVEVLFEVDATKLEENDILKEKSFDRIIFNFPHVGGKSNIKKNRELIKSFFKSAVTKLADSGDICVSFAQGQGGTPADRPIREWHDSWQGVAAAAYQDLVLKEIWPFDIKEYPHYKSTGFRSLDRPFYTGGAMTYVFRRCDPLSPIISTNYNDVTINENIYCINSQYIAARIHRCLFLKKGHPLNLIKANIEGIIEEEVQNVEFYSPPLIIAIQPCDGASRKQQYYLTLQNGIQPHNIIRGSESLQKPSVNNPDLCLRRTLLDCPVTELKDGILYYSYGNVFRRRSQLDCKRLTTGHEILLSLHGSDCSENYKIVTDLILNILTNLLGCEHQIVLSSDCDEIDTYLLDHLHSSKSVVIISNSVNQSVTAACNQVMDTGKPTVPKPIDINQNYSKMSRLCACIGTRNNTVVAVLDADSLCQIKYDIPDARLLWSENTDFLEQFMELKPEDSYRYCPLSMYPPLWRHDLSFWENPQQETFQEEELMDMIQDVTGDSLKCATLSNVWTDPETYRVSRCYRFVYQSYEKAISHTAAHQLQDAIRQTVADQFDVEIR